jgi:cytochrome c-type biogenesis protein CcmH
VRERLVAGDSDGAVTQYLVDRYGEFVLLSPVVAPHTLLLWVAAPAVLLIGGVAVLFGARRRRKAALAAEPPLSEAEAAALRELEEPDR